MCLEYPLWVYHNAILCVSNCKSSIKRLGKVIGDGLDWKNLKDIKLPYWNVCSMSKGIVYTSHESFLTLTVEVIYK